LSEAKTLCESARDAVTSALERFPDPSKAPKWLGDMSEEISRFLKLCRDKMTLK
jgi:hypothetical protein